MRFFGVWIVLFLYSKRFLFSMQSRQALFLVLFRPNLNKPNNWHFFTKSMSYPPEKMRFFGLWKMPFFKVKNKFFSLRSQKALFLVLFWSNLNKEKNGIFGKADFLDFEKFCFLRPKKVFLSLQSQKALFLGLVWSNLNKEKLAFFGQKHGLTPLNKKCDFLDFEKFFLL